MGLLKLLTQFAPNRVFLAVVLGAMGGIGYALLIAIVLIATGSGPGDEIGGGADVRRVLWFYVAHYHSARVFAVVCCAILGARAASQMLLAGVAVDAATSLRLNSYKQIMRAPIVELEQIGASRLLAALTSDVQRITAGASLIPMLTVSGVTLAAAFAYLYFLNPAACRFSLEALAFGMLTYQVPMILSRGYFVQGRRVLDALYEAINGLVGGSKELKLSRKRRQQYFNELLLRHEGAVSRSHKRGTAIVTAAASYGELASFFVIGVLAFIFANYHAMTREEIVGVVMVVLYAVGPISAILNGLPQLAVAAVSLRSMRQVLVRLSPEKTDEHSRVSSDWSALKLRNVAFRYSDPGRSFQLGPITLDIERGQITFIVGGNGSGKSTLGKILSLHYAPLTGDICCDDTRVDAWTISSFREQVCAIFADFFLFDRLLDDPVQGRADEGTAATRLLGEFGLDTIVSLREGRFSTTVLSSGQRKRLALILALLEERQLYVFDEWAADQEPRFKEVFYNVTLPSLRERGKAVVVITHDERYFHVADKVVILEDGKLSKTEVPGALSLSLARG